MEVSWRYFFVVELYSEIGYRGCQLKFNCEISLSTHFEVMAMSIRADNREYEPIVESGQVVGLRQFNPQHKIWIELRFDEKADRKIEEDFIAILTGEYMSRQMG